MSDEQTSGQPATKKVATQDMETPSDAWGQPISEERQAELQRYIDRRKGRHNSTQERPTLTGADVFWLAERSERDAAGRVPNLHLERADLRGAHLDGARLRMAHLEGADLTGAHLNAADLVGCTLMALSSTRRICKGPAFERPA